MTRPTFTDAVRYAPVRLPDGREGHLWHFPSRPGYGRDQATVDIAGELVTVHVDDVEVSDV